MAKDKPTAGGGLDAVFLALDALTYREMLALAQLFALQAEDRELTDPSAFAELLADAADSHFAEADEDDG
jgi:hypothetical protein